MARLFVEVDPDDRDRATLGADGVRHLRALRLGPGDRFEAILGPRDVRAATVERVTKRGATVRLGDTVAAGGDPARPVILVVALADLGRFDSLVEKATELGATAVVPLRAARSQIGSVTPARRERWRRIARSACEQCGRTEPPEIRAEVSLDTLSEELPDGARIVAFDPSAKEPWEADAADTGSLVLVVGPEGGFTDDELGTLGAGGASLRSLGPRTLRFETAALAALAIAGAKPA